MTDLDIEFKKPKVKTVNGGLLLLMVFIMVAILIGTGLYIKSAPTPSDVRIGDTWEHYSNGNPFDKNDEKVRVVIGVKMGFVQFIENENDTISVPQEEFLKNSIKVK